MVVRLLVARYINANATHKSVCLVVIILSFVRSFILWCRFFSSSTIYLTRRLDFLRHQSAHWSFVWSLPSVVVWVIFSLSLYHSPQVQLSIRTTFRTIESTSSVSRASYLTLWSSVSANWWTLKSEWVESRTSCFHTLTYHVFCPSMSLALSLPYSINEID